MQLVKEIVSCGLREWPWRPAVMDVELPACLGAFVTAARHRIIVQAMLPRLSRAVEEAFASARSGCLPKSRPLNFKTAAPRARSAAASAPPAPPRLDSSVEGRRASGVAGSEEKGRLEANAFIILLSFVVFFVLKNIVAPVISRTRMSREFLSSVGSVLTFLRLVVPEAAFFLRGGISGSHKHLAMSKAAEQGSRAWIPDLGLLTSVTNAS